MSLRASFFDQCKKIMPILQAIKQAGGTAYLVGGSVRDLVLERPLKDFDIEVHELTIDELEKVLKKFGPVMLIGKQFGVLRLSNHDIDWSLPRKDSTGRKPEVIIDPYLSIQEACRRRDLTMNAMALDLNKILDNLNQDYQILDNIIDPYNGLEDIKTLTLRAVDEKLFLEDPLRFYRVMQFVGRFAMKPDNNLNTLCAHMSLCDPVTGQPIAQERIYEEIKKLFLKSQKPSLGFRWLLEINRLHDTFPELQNLVKTPQRPDYHPEGSVFEHTMQALDAAARFKLNDEEKFLIMLAVLCHDLGKAVSTSSDLSAHGHEETGVPLAKNLLKKITRDNFLTKAVTKLVRYHLLPGMFLKDSAGQKSYKRLASKLAPEVTLRQLALVALADMQGRNGQSHEPLDLFYDFYETFLEKANQAHVINGPEEPILLGRHLLEHVPAGPELGRLLKKAYLIQIEENIQDPEELKKRVLSDRF